MKNKTKIKLIIILLISLLIGAFVFWGVIHFHFKNNISDNPLGNLSSAEEDILISSKTYPTNILVYGSEIDFDKRLNVTYIDKISKNSLKFDNNFSYQYIVINDLDNKTDLSDEEWKLIGKTVKSDKRCNFIYLGSKELYKIKNSGILAEGTIYEPEDLSIGLFHEKERLITVMGTYTTECLSDGDSISEAILCTYVTSLKICNE